MLQSAIATSTAQRLYTRAEVEDIVAPWREMLVEAHLRQAALIRSLTQHSQTDNDRDHWSSPSWREAALDYRADRKLRR
jgi:hypothetical protein